MTNPKKKKTVEILEAWTSLKEKLITIITELKTNHKDKWALVKPTGFNWTQILTETELQKQITEREKLIYQLNQRPSNHLLSPTDQTKLTQAQSELLLLKKRQNIEHFPADDYFQQLRKVNEKYDQLNDKLNWLRTLVRAGDLPQLQDLVCKAKI